MTATFLWAPTRPYARANSITTYNGNFLQPCYTGNAIYQSTATALAALSLTVSLATVAGWQAATTDSAGNAWLLPTNGSSLLKLPAAGPSGATTYSMSAKPAWTGVAAIGTTPYMLSSDGNLYTLSGSTVTLVVGAGHETLGLTSDGTNVWTLIPTAPQLARFTIAGASINVFATPMTTPSCLAGSAAHGIAVGGWSPAAIAQGTVALTASPVTPTTTSAAISTTANAVYMVTGTDPLWAVTQTVTGTGAPSALTWVPNGQQVMVSDKANGKLQVYNLAGFTLTASTLLTIAGVSSVASTPDSTTAVATQPGSNQLQVLADTLGVWSLGATIADTNGPQAIIALSNTEMVYGVTGGITFLEFVTAAWSIGTHVTMGLDVTNLTTDGAGNIYAIGTSGGSGFLTVASKAGGILASTSWTGSADAVLWNQGQIFVVDSTSSLVRAFAWLAGGLVVEPTTTSPAGCKGISLSGQSIWLSGSASLAQFQMTAPFTLKPMAVGEVSIYASSAWTSCALPVGTKPSAVTWDASGNVWVSSETNDVYEISTAGAILSHTNVPVYTGQEAGVTMGFSSLLWNGGHLYAATSLSGALVEIQ